MKNKKGFTLIEVLITTAIGVVTASVIASYITFLSRLHNQMKLRRISGNVIHSLTESVRYNLSLFQVTFDNTPNTMKAMLEPAKLPLGISGNNLVQRTECASVGCQAYVGYVIVPSEFVRNLYEVKFLVVSPDKEAKWSTEFTYFITVK